MRRWIMAACVALLSGPMAWAQSEDITGVIGQQIEAFRADDFETAFSFASPSIQGIFRDPDTFRRMVTQGYPMVWRPADVEFLGLRDWARGYAQRVRIVDAEGRVHVLDYYMIETENGWKINGVELLKDEGATA